MHCGRAPVMSPLHRQIHESSDSSESASALCSLLHRRLDAGVCIIRYIGARHRADLPIYSLRTHRRRPRNVNQDDFPYNSNPARSISGRIDRGVAIQCKQAERPLDSCDPKSVSSVCCVCARDVYGTLTSCRRHYDRWG